MFRKRRRNPLRSMKKGRPRRGTDTTANHGPEQPLTKPARLALASIEPQPEAEHNRLPEGIKTLGRTLDVLASILPRLADALDRKAESQPPVERLTLRLDELAEALGVSRRVLERERSAGRLPKPDLHIGKMPLWRVQTILDWLEGGGHR